MDPNFDYGEIELTFGAPAAEYHRFFRHFFLCFCNLVIYRCRCNERQIPASPELPTKNWGWQKFEIGRYSLWEMPKKLVEQDGNQYEGLVRAARGHWFFSEIFLVTQLGCRFPKDTLNTERFWRYVCMELWYVNGACNVLSSWVGDGFHFSSETAIGLVKKTLRERSELRVHGMSLVTQKQCVYEQRFPTQVNKYSMYLTSHFIGVVSKEDL